MPIPPAINKVLYNDAGNTSSYPGSGTSWVNIGSSSGNNLTLVNTPAFVYFPGYFDFSGANRSAEGPGFPNITVTGPFSFNVWFRIDGVLGNTFMLIYATGVGGPSQSTSCGWTFLEYAGNLAMFAKGAAFYSNVGSYVTGKWHQFTCTVNASGDTKCYVDGSLTFTQLGGQWGSGNTVGAASQIGGLAADPTLRLDGDVALVEVYDTELSATDVSDLYQSYVGRFSTTFYLNASESLSASGSGATWYDLTTNNYDFTMTSPSFSAVGATTPGYFEFPISNTVHPPVSYGSYTSGVAVTDTSWTIYAWVNYSGNGSTTNVARYPIFWNGIDPTVSTDGWNFQLTGPTQAPAGRLQLEGKTVGSTTNSTVVPADQWVQVAATLNGSSGTFYVNGTSVGTFSGFTFITPTSSMFIEKTYNDSFPGNISIVRLFDTPLSGAAISSLYTYDLDNYFTFAPPPPPSYAGLVGGRVFGQGFAG